MFIGVGRFHFQVSQWALTMTITTTATAAGAASARLQECVTAEEAITNFSKSIKTQNSPSLFPLSLSLSLSHTFSDSLSLSRLRAKINTNCILQHTLAHADLPFVVSSLFCWFNGYKWASIEVVFYQNNFWKWTTKGSPSSSSTLPSLLLQYDAKLDSAQKIKQKIDLYKMFGCRAIS